MMKNGMLFGENHSYNNFGMIPARKITVTPPVPKTNYIEIPGADGMLDMSESLTGCVLYQNRALEGDFNVNAPRSKWPRMQTEMMNQIQGESMRLILDEEPSFFYFGRPQIAEWKYVNNNHALVKIKADIEPYKYERYGSMEDWVWDDFCFETDIIREYKDIVVDDTQVRLTIPGRKKKVIPTIYATVADGDRLTVAYGGGTWALDNGANKIVDIAISSITENVLLFTGKGTVSVDYRGGAL